MLNLKLTVLFALTAVPLSSPHTTNLQRDAPTSHEFMAYTHLFSAETSSDLTAAEPAGPLSDCTVRQTQLSELISIRDIVLLPDDSVEDEERHQW